MTEDPKSEFTKAILKMAAEHPDWFIHLDRKKFDTDYDYALAVYEDFKKRFEKRSINKNKQRIQNPASAGWERVGEGN